MGEGLRALHNITGAQLQAFLAVVEAGGFSTAAEALEITQPTISKTVRALEQKTGPLFERRRGSSIRLNRAGEVLREMAPLMIQRLIEFRRRLDTARGQAVTLRACTGTYLYAPLQRQIEEFHRRQPLIRVQLTRSPSRLGALQLLKLGAVDAVFITHFTRPAELRPEHVRDAQIMLYDSAEAVAAGARNRPLILIADVELVQRGEHNPHSSQMPHSADGVLYAHSYPALVEMCARGMGRAYLLEEDAAPEVARGAISPIPSEAIDCWRACHVLGDDPIVLAFVNAMLQGLP
jgi:DNA-binding transcriptional LysR family regulator